MIYHDLVILGGGASGLTAAISAKNYNVDVAIIEGTDRVGKKILTTGNGRCNISNSSISAPFYQYHSNNDGFYDNVLSSFSVSDTSDFLYSLGLPLTTLPNGKIYPQSLQSSSVVDIMRLSLEDRNIPVYNSFKVKKISTDKGKFILSTGNDSEVIHCGKLIVACGGKSAPKTGSDGSAYNLVKSLGHTITRLNPAIVQLKLDYPKLKSISGIKFDGYASVLIDNKEVRKEFGEILFTDYGISGPPILQISRIASIGCDKNQDVKIKVNMMPSFTKEELSDFLENHFGLFSYRSVSDAFIGLINKKLIPALLKEAGLNNIHKPCYELTWKDKQNIINLLTEWTFTCIGTNGFNNAQVTAGGVDTTLINDSTLESKIIKNLFFCGEILDVDGDCGGYNLQWAWSSGFVAGKSAALSV